MEENPTLINQLMMAADAWMRLANEHIPGLNAEQSQALYQERANRATSLRERAEWIRHWRDRTINVRDNPNTPIDDMTSVFVLSMIDLLIGPLND